MKRAPDVVGDVFPSERTGQDEQRGWGDIYDGLSKCLFPVLLINRNSMRAASCLPLKNMTYLDDVKTWKFFVTFENLSKTTGIG